MANEVAVIARTGQTLEVDVFQPDGTEREFGVSVTETGQGRLYLGDCSTIQPGDIQIAYNTVSGNVEGGGEYRQQVSAIGSQKIVPAGYIGDYIEDDIVYFLWRTTSVPSADGTILVYKNDGTGEVTTPMGIVDTRNFDSKTGVHLCSINLSANSFYAKERDYSVVLNGATIDGETVNAVIATFSIEQRYAGREFLKNG